MDPVIDVLRAVVAFRSGALAVMQAQLVDVLSKAFGSSDTEEGLIILGMVVKVRLAVISLFIEAVTLLDLMSGQGQERCFCGACLFLLACILGPFLGSDLVGMQVFKLVARHADGRRALCAFPTVPATLESVLKQTQYDTNAWKVFKRTFRCVSGANFAR